MIYFVPNFVTNVFTYVCPDQATIDQGKAEQYTGNFAIGFEAEAQLILESNRQEYLPTIVNLFSVNKDIDPDPIQTTWILCDLNTEEPNTDVNYNVFDVLNGYYNMATGLDNAKTLLQQTKQAYIEAVMRLVAYSTWNDIPKPIITNNIIQEF